MIDEEETGYWFADIDTEQVGDYQWQPVLELDGMCLSTNIWFRTKAECVAFIVDSIIGATLDPADDAEGGADGAVRPTGGLTGGPGGPAGQGRGGRGVRATFSALGELLLLICGYASFIVGVITDDLNRMVMGIGFLIIAHLTHDDDKET